MQMNFPVTGYITILVFHTKDLCEARANFKVSSYLADGPPCPIDHRSLEHHYTESLGHPDIKFYPPFQPTFMQMNFPVTGYITILVFHTKDLCEARANFKVSSYLADGPPCPIDHRSMEHHLHQRSVIYSRMHINPWQTDPTPLLIDHRSMQHHYTK